MLAIVTHNPSASAISEMNWSVAQGKLLIPIISPGVSPEYYSNFQPFFVVDPVDPSQAEQQIRYLAQKQQSETANGALIGHATLSVALLLLGAVSSDS